jgi:hypothetical protein
MNLENVTREDWTVGGIALALLITLVGFPWFSASIGPFTATSTATGSPDGWLGFLAVLALIALIADLAIERFSPSTNLPEIGGSRAATRFVLAAGAAAVLLLKFLFHIDFTGIVSFAWGFYLAVLLSAALLFFSLQARNGATR